LSGRYDERAEARRSLQVLVGFGDVDDHGNTTNPHTLADAIRGALADGTYPENFDEAAVRRDIARHMK